ncbi:MAG: hypothetical protein H7061_06075 [Bdellovibrionaceae bacterium]|nr:hypothetical protein [Bdellovibrio sp.]
MKMFLFATAFSLVSATASAQPISLKPGSEAYVNGDVISCVSEVPAKVLPFCTIKPQGTSDFFSVFIGAERVLIDLFKITNAVAGVKTLREAGLCQ